MRGDQVFDDAGRLRVRQITPGTGVAGVTMEGYDYDALDRLTRAISGAIVTDVTYDSLGRLTTETTAGKMLRVRHDLAGNDVGWTYPSGLQITRGFDALDRLNAVGIPGAPASILSLSYLGPERRAAVSLGNGLSGTWSHDAAGRTLAQRIVTTSNDPVLSETLSWTPRGLKGAAGRGDLNGDGMIFGYDGANRVVTAARARVTPGLVPNNTTPPLAPIAGGYGFTYDEAQNQLERTTVRAGVADIMAMPSDGSGRNRPGAIVASEVTSLSWDAGGRLAQKGELSFEYDYRGRLVRVRRLGAEIALYEYDAFNRKIFRTVEGVERQTVWSGLRPVEDYSDGGLRSRRVFGPGLDEIVRMEVDVDDDGQLDQSYVPLYDHAGNVAVLTGALGLPVERYRYAPYGPETIEVDEVAPQVTQARVYQGTIRIEMGESLNEEAFLRGLAQGAVELSLDGLALLKPTPATAGGASHQPNRTVSAASGTGGFTVELPVLEGPQAARRLVIHLAEPPAAGADVSLILHPEAVADEFLNRPSAPWSLSFEWPAGDQILVDATPPEIERVAVVDGRVQIELSEPPDVTAAAGSLLLNGGSTSWTLSEDGYRLTSGSTLAAGTHQLEIGTGFADQAGNALAAPRSWSFDLTTALRLLVYEAINPRLVETSSAGNDFGFHGLELDKATGLIYARNRWYDPELGRFLTADPLGYVDGPNPYAYALNNPINFSDPMGLQAGADDPKEEEEGCFDSWGAAWDCVVEPFTGLAESARKWDQHFRENALGRRDPTDTGLEALSEQTRLTGDVAGDAFDAGLRVSDVSGAGGLVTVAFRVGGRIVTKQVARHHLPELLNAGWEVVDDDVAEYGARRVPRGSFQPPRIQLNRHGQLTNELYTVDAAGMTPHKLGSLRGGRSQFLSTVDAEKAVLDAAAYADEAGLWVGNKAKVFVENGPVGVLGETGELTHWINVYRTRTGFVHGAPGGAP